ncbi:hypothetical protein DCS_02016 [Drechmeria coniospora]|uniref:Uncharacterized protein n=1 Tax=Drechmeria coniospora TaxID=98403 RepID=A0A151GUX1_DRECN|nr:hypothetical protein DCS_02016 [Drechmeria coniospora]KYK60878.1 hypothetical protein DCS_02016 [Drechmeria coniospora]
MSQVPQADSDHFHAPGRAVLTSRQCAGRRRRRREYEYEYEYGYGYDSARRLVAVLGSHLVPRADTNEVGWYSSVLLAPLKLQEPGRLGRTLPADDAEKAASTTTAAIEARHAPATRKRDAPVVAHHGPHDAEASHGMTMLPRGRERSHVDRPSPQRPSTMLVAVKGSAETDSGIEGRCMMPPAWRWQHAQPTDGNRNGHASACEVDMARGARGENEIHGCLVGHGLPAGPRVVAAVDTTHRGVLGGCWVHCRVRALPRVRTAAFQRLSVHSRADTAQHERCGRCQPSHHPPPASTGTVDALGTHATERSLCLLPTCGRYLMSDTVPRRQAARPPQPRAPYSYTCPRWRASRALARGPTQSSWTSIPSSSSFSFSKIAAARFVGCISSGGSFRRVHQQHRLVSSGASAASARFVGCITSSHASTALSRRPLVHESDEASLGDRGPPWVSGPSLAARPLDGWPPFRHARSMPVDGSRRRDGDGKV